jgi:RIO kinase 1
MMDAYMDVVDIMRTMYQTCRLVHADLSEYNLLWHENRVFVIDVSQSVETDHPRATEFLRMDCQNISDYFRRGGVTTISPRELFDYVVHVRLGTKELEQAYLDAARNRAEERAASGEAEPESEELSGAIAAGQHAAEVEAAVFMQAYIPSSLAGVRDVEADTDAVARGEGSALYYAAMTGLAPGPGAQAGLGLGASGASKHDNDDKDTASVVQKPKKPAKKVKVWVDSDSEGEEGSGDESGCEEGSEEEGEGEEDKAALGEVGWTRKDAETKDEKKAHKAAVKAAAREKRKVKMPKHVKKRAVKGEK